MFITKIEFILIFLGIRVVFLKNFVCRNWKKLEETCMVKTLSLRKNLCKNRVFYCEFISSNALLRASKMDALSANTLGTMALDSPFSQAEYHALVYKS